MKKIEVLHYLYNNKEASLAYFAEYNNDKYVVLTAVLNKPMDIMYASDELKDDKHVVLTAVSQYAHLSIDNNVENSDCAFRHASKRLRHDRDVVLAFVTFNGWALNAVPKKFLDDEEVILTAVCNDNRSIVYASDNLKENLDFALKTVQLQASVLTYMPEWCINSVIALEAIKSNSYVLNYCTDLFCDFNFVKKIISLEHTFDYFPIILKSRIITTMPIPNAIIDDILLLIF